MKKILLILTITCCSLFTYSQKLFNNEIPEAVQNAFQTKFSNTDDVAWSKQGNKYVVQFEIGRTDYKAIFGEQGKMHMYKREIRVDEIPTTILSKINHTYRYQKIADVEKVVKDGEVFYQMELDSRNFYAKVVYTADGEPNHINYWD